MFSDRKVRRLELALLVVMMLVLGRAEAMSILDVGKVCVFSEVKVQVTRDGEPVRNARVIRRWEWGRLKEETTTTDDQGYFSFPPVFERSLARLLPVELVIGQGLYVVENGVEERIWTNSKREPEENAEFGGQTIEMTCELSDEMVLYDEFGSLMHTRCRWPREGTVFNEIGSDSN